MPCASSGYGAEFCDQIRFSGDGLLQLGSKMNPQLQNSSFSGSKVKGGVERRGRGEAAVGVCICLKEMNVNL